MGVRSLMGVRSRRAPGLSSRRNSFRADEAADQPRTDALAPSPAGPVRNRRPRAGIRVSTWQRAAATAVPAVVPPAMWGVFRATTRRFGRRRGTQAGFAAYWATCWAVAGAIAGPDRLTAAFRAADRPLTERPVLGGALLALPPIGAVITELLPNVRRAGPAALGVSMGLAVTNAVAEETLWRALPVSVFPGETVRGWLWPAAGFAAWHLAPLTAAGVPRGRRAGVLLGATLIGLGYGWVAHRTGSVAAVVGPHVATDACGVRSARDTWLGG